MWPWGHAAVGYCLFTVLSMAYRRRPLTTKEAVVVVIGTQIPDLVDKPLSWSFGLLPSGRSLGHSLLVWAVVAVVVLVLARKVQRDGIATLLLGGYFVGAITDVPGDVLADVSRATFLVWPVLPSPVYDAEPSFLFHLAQLEADELVRAPLILLTIVAIQFVLSTLVRVGRDRVSESA